MTTLADELRTIGLFDGLTDEQLAGLAAGSDVVPIEPGGQLFGEGQAAVSWFVLLDGEVDLVRHVGREAMVVARMQQPGQWAGGLRAWDDDGTYLASGRGAAPGRVLRVPADFLRARSAEWFPFALHLIRGVFQTARRIEATVRERESLVALGELTADLAHEINNPAAAASRAVGDLADGHAALLDAVGRLAGGGLAPGAFTALEALRAGLVPARGPVGALELSDREDELSDWLDDRGVDETWRIAPALAAAGADPAWCGRVADLLGPQMLAPGLGYLAATLTLPVLVGDLRETTGRISELVGAMKVYSQMDRASRQRVDVTQGLNSTLAVLARRFGENVRVVREYAPGLDRIEAYAGELNQVWTQLLTNAAEAMNGTGTLRVSVAPDGDGITVEIGDTGPGMPPEVLEHAFEAFFTSRPGHASGLGLDIARRIVVERHGGSITLHPGPPETVVRVGLPG